jgi:lipoprotein NlpD
MPRKSGLAALAFATLLAACASTGPAPVEDLSTGRPPRVVEPAPVRAVAATPGTYRVERGDTLYSIAFRHGVDYRELADWNAIGAPYTIYVGQALTVRAPQRPRAVARATPVKPATPPAAVPARPAPFEPVTATPAPVASPSSSPAAPPPPPATAPPPVVVATTAPPPVAPPPAPRVDEPVAPGEIGWRWPANGAVVGTFSSGDPTRQGIDIAGHAGDPVRAAADGVVVYSGNGLLGYGELVIVKHSPVFLSAYGHNRKRLVKEGDRVTAGQEIAEMGSSSATRDSLHFEIRRNGKPTNPGDYLPRR